MRVYSKAIAAFASAVLSALLVGVPSNWDEWSKVLIASAITALGVYLAPKNADA